MMNVAGVVEGGEEGVSEKQRPVRSTCTATRQLGVESVTCGHLGIAERGRFAVQGVIGSEIIALGSSNRL